MSDRIICAMADAAAVLSILAVAAVCALNVLADACEDFGRRLAVDHG